MSDVPMVSVRDLVLEFHQIFGAPIAESPALPRDDLLQMRTELIIEESSEFVEAAFEKDMVGMADALADLVYVCYGAAVTLGIDLDDVIREVHRSNLTKLGSDGKPIYRNDGKVLKGPGYEPPDIRGVLALQGQDVS